MQSKLTNLLFLVMFLLGSNYLQAQFFNFDYFTSISTQSVQNSLVTLQDGASLSVHNQPASKNIEVVTRDILINKVDINGNILFTKVYSSIDSVAEHGNAILELSNRDFLVVGGQRHPVFDKFGLLVYRIDANGDIVWSNWYGDLQSDVNAEGFAIKAVSKNEFLIAGSSPRTGQLVALLIDGNGDQSWFKQYVFPGSEARATRQVTDLIKDIKRGTYIIAGTQTSSTIRQGQQMFAFGIDLTGKISSKYLLYRFGNLNSSNPNFEYSFDEGNFIVTLTTSASLISSQGRTNSFITVTELNNNCGVLK